MEHYSKIKKWNTEISKNIIENLNQLDSQIPFSSWNSRMGELVSGMDKKLMLSGLQDNRQI